MSKPFDMELLLASVLSGSHATQQRHVRQAKIIQVAIAERWHRENPWTWQKTHVVWFLENSLSEHSPASQYYYALTVRLLARRLETSWVSSSDGDLILIIRIGCNRPEADDLSATGSTAVWNVCFR